MSSEFENKVVIVTGSSRGIGAAIAVAFARKGASVIGVARSDQKDVIAEAGKNFHPMSVDLGNASAEQLSVFIGGVVEKFKRIDALVNNAGIIRRAPAVDFSEQDWNDVLRTNLTSPFFLAQAVARWWITKGKSEADPADRLKIVNIASLLSFQGGILVPSYAASKHAIAGVTKALANEWAPLRINVNAIAPGYVETENTRALREDAARNQAILSRIPQGHWGQPEGIAGACTFLASRDADYINGAILNVDGGWLAR